MGRFKQIICLMLMVSIFGGTLSGCNSRANEEEDVRDAQKKLDEEKADLSKED